MMKRKTIMILREVKINNFRNIKHAEYKLGRINMWTGPNQTGKTNTILAVYWAMTDFLMDGSSDYPSFKPLTDSKAEVSVELIFDEFSLKKTFKEKWTKTRGSSEVTMTGHDTTYWIDGTKLSVTEAKKELIKRFGVSVDTGSFDLLRGIVDPYYFGKTCDWKVLRSFIIQLCGDVSNDDIFAADNTIIPIKERLEIDKYDTGRTSKFFKQELKNVIDGITELNGKIAGLEEIKDPSEDDIAFAESEIKRLNKGIDDLKSGNGSASIIDELNNQLQEAKLHLRECQTADAEQLLKDNKAINDQISAKQIEINASVTKSSDILSVELAPCDRKLADLKADLIRETDNKDRNTNKRESLYSQYDQLSSWVAPEGTKCPNCGCILNQEYLDQVISEHQKKVDDCVADGKSCKIEIDNSEIKIKEITDKTESIRRDHTNAEDRYNAEQKHTDLLRKELAELQNHLKISSESKETLEARDKVNQINDQIRNEYLKENSDEDSIRDAVNEIKSRMVAFQNTLDAHAGYRLSQNKIAELQKDIESSQKSQVSIEQKLMMVEKFIQIKLTMFAKNISSVFGTKMKFTLIQNNIKEGSWSEVCVPHIIDKDTPFLDGSGSEQILTGIYFAECVKKKLEIADLPYIFDECDKLDQKHLAAIDTKAQILSTIVDDVHYKDVTLQSED
jgi:chromosome segregation ATPase